VLYIYIYHLKLHVTFESLFDQNLIVIDVKFNGNFKSHVNFEIKEIR